MYAIALPTSSFPPLLRNAALTSRVSIALHGTNKHRLPVPKNCTVQHGAGMPPTGVCTFSNGSRPGDYASLWQCMREAACPIIDERNQMVIFRDPRSLVVSAYFYLLALSRTEDTVDQFVARMLPTFCQWVAVRYILFQGNHSKTWRRSAVVTYKFVTWSSIPCHERNNLSGDFCATMGGSLAALTCHGIQRTITVWLIDRPQPSPPLAVSVEVDSLSKNFSAFVGCLPTGHVN